MTINTYTASKVAKVGVRPDEAAQAKPVHPSENDTHHSLESDTVDATLPKRSVDPKCVPKPSSIKHKRFSKQGALQRNVCVDFCR